MIGWPKPQPRRGGRSQRREPPAARHDPAAQPARRTGRRAPWPCRTSCCRRALRLLGLSLVTVLGLSLNSHNQSIRTTKLILLAADLIQGQRVPSYSATVDGFVVDLSDMPQDDGKRRRTI